MDRNGYNRPLLIASAIAAVVLILVGIITLTNASSITEPTGTVLTENFIEAYSYKKAYQSLGEASLVSVFFLVGTMLLALLWNTSRRSLPGKIAIVVMMLAIPVVYLGKIMPENIDILVHKPHVETVSVFSRTVSHGRKHSYYKFIFSNGKKGRVSYEEYKNVPDGAEYYIIVCGQECTGAFNADSYSLPRQP